MDSESSWSGTAGPMLPYDEWDIVPGLAGHAVGSRLFWALGVTPGAGWLWLRPPVGYPDRRAASDLGQDPKGRDSHAASGVRTDEFELEQLGDSMDEITFSQLFDSWEGPYHLYDAQNRPLIRAETGKWVLAALLEDQNQLVFLDDPGCHESSVLKKTFWTREWLSDPIFPKPCSCSDGRCKGRLVITLHDSYAGPSWKLTFRG